MFKNTKSPHSDYLARPRAGLSKWTLSGGRHSPSFFSQLARFCWVHFLWLTVTILDSWWAEITLLDYSISVYPTGTCEADNFEMKLALKQPASCGWLVSDKLLFLWQGRCRAEGLLLAWLENGTGLSRQGRYSLGCLTEIQRECGETTVMKKGDTEEMGRRETQACNYCLFN